MSRRVVVYHRGHGCETGCCGHAIEVDEDGKTDERFEFEHPRDEDPRAFAERLVRAALGEDHVADLDWENCTIVDD